MCYNAVQLALKIYKDAKKMNASDEEIKKLKENWEELQRQDKEMYLASGFKHDQLFTYNMENHALNLSLNHWGLIPNWAKDADQALSIWNKTINARGETIFEKPSFKDAALNSRSIIPLDGFYEYHTKSGKSFPYFIRKENEDKMYVAGLNSHWENQSTGEIINTTTIVTTKGNELLTEIHNNPKLKEPRMPLILNENDLEIWLKGSTDDAIDLIKPNTSVKLKAHTVRKLTGQSSVGNSKEATEEYIYDELNELF